MHSQLRCEHKTASSNTLALKIFIEQLKILYNGLQTRSLKLFRLQDGRGSVSASPSSAPTLHHGPPWRHSPLGPSLQASPWRLQRGRGVPAVSSSK